MNRCVKTGTDADKICHWTIEIWMIQTHVKAPIRWLVLQVFGNRSSGACDSDLLFEPAASWDEEQGWSKAWDTSRTGRGYFLLTQRTQSENPDDPRSALEMLNEGRGCRVAENSLKKHLVTLLRWHQ
jgi:hypothetical protein